MGFVLSDSKILLYAEKKREYFLFFSIILFIIVAILQTESYAKGFGYEGVSKIISSDLLFACFYLLQEKFFSCFCKRLVKWLSKYELGIYCSHVLIRTCVYGIFMVIGLPKYTFGGSILIWSFSLALSVLISLIPSNFFRGMVK